MLLLMCTWATPSIVYEQHNYPHSELNSTCTIDMDHYEVTAMDDITEFQPNVCPCSKKAEDILEGSLAPKVVASFSTTKTEVFAETNCCSSLLGQ
ncbi:hypothetical protein MKW92_007170 [Papaver armeniacum]|nr:hypothetical protein MKW92_007170 [Papaver armeniacum]